MQAIGEPEVLILLEVEIILSLISSSLPSPSFLFPSRSPSLSPSFISSFLSTSDDFQCAQHSVNH